MKRAALVIAALGLAPLAQADPRFENLSDRLPKHVYSGGWEHFVGGGVALFDCNADDLPDIFAAGGAADASLIMNLGDWQFSRKPLPSLKGATGAYPMDIDNDGLSDLFVLRVGPNVLLRGRGGCAFEDATASLGLPAGDAWSTAFTAWWDVGAEKPKLAIGNYVDRTDPDGPFEACDDNQLLTPSPQGYTETALTPGFCPLSILAARDARGRMALRLSNDRHYYVKGGVEQMWDIGERRFLTEADGWPTVSLWGMGIASRDLTGDGRDEVMLTSMGDQVLQIASDDGSYRAAPFDIGTYAQRPYTGGDGRPSTGWHAEFGDVNNDGLADLFIAKGNVDQMPGMAQRDPNNLLIQMPDGRFVERGEEAGIASLERGRGGGFADFDGDGRLDLLVSNRRAPLELYRNVTPDTGGWIRVNLAQAGANRNAIGARITVTSADKTQSVQSVVGGGHAGGQALPFHFGLGHAAEADVTIDWPDGTQTKHRLDAGRSHDLVKP